jgi:hypothetical protein
MNFLELCQRLRQDTGSIGTGPETVTSQSGNDARLVSWIRSAWQEIQTERRWLFDWTQGGVTLNTSDTQYAMPTDLDVWEPNTLAFDGRKIDVLPWAELEAAPRFTAAALAPDGSLHLNAKPDTAGILTFEYWRTPQNLIANTDVPRMPERFHMAIVYRAHKQYGFYESAPEAVEIATINEDKVMNNLTRSQLPHVDLPESLA